MSKDTTTTLQQLRQDYALATLSIDDVHTNPIQQFERWFEEAQKSAIEEPNAMTLATVDSNGIPAARIVLLKGLNETGFYFYTNYESQKGQEMAQNPNVALLFLWLGLQRQVRIVGKVARLSEEASTAYFQKRPKGSQIGAWASPQSTVIKDRTVLEEKVNALKEQYKEADVLPKPAHWGGYVVMPTEIEFWQGRSSRLHDRLRYQKDATGNWVIERLAP